MGEEGRMAPHVISLFDSPDPQPFLGLVPSLIDANLQICFKDTMILAPSILALLATISFTFAAPSVTLPLEVKNGRGELHMRHLAVTSTDARELRLSDVL